MRKSAWLSLLLAPALSRATIVPRLSLEDLVDESETIVEGRVQRSWTAWDPAHRYIWTHHELAISDRIKGAPQSSVIISEPGGTLDGVTLQIPGTVPFRAGEEIIVFLYRTPIGYLRTCGYGQGKYSISGNGAPAQKKVRTNTAGLTLLDIKPIELPLDGMSVSEFKSRVRVLVEQRGRKGNR
jgi:hypothetical protein